MPNPLYNVLQPSGPMQGQQALLQQFNQFRNNFRGNPKDTVMEMVRSGRISQNQLNQLQQAASAFQAMFR